MWHKMKSNGTVKDYKSPQRSTTTKLDIISGSNKRQNNNKDGAH